jgi:hypothetical protein
MVNLEPSWSEIGAMLIREIRSSNIEPEVRNSLIITIVQMAEICHRARSNQLGELIKSGSDVSLPSWFEVTEGGTE